MPAPHESFATTMPPTAPSGGVRVHIGVKIVGGALVGLAWLLFLSEFVRPKIVRVLLDNDWSGSALYSGAAAAVAVPVFAWFAFACGGARLGRSLFRKNPAAPRGHRVRFWFAVACSALLPLVVSGAPTNQYEQWEDRLLHANGYVAGTVLIATSLTATLALVPTLFVISGLAQWSCSDRENLRQARTRVWVAAGALAGWILVVALTGWLTGRP